MYQGEACMIIIFIRLKLLLSVYCEIPWIKVRKSESENFYKNKGKTWMDNENECQKFKLFAKFITNLWNQNYQNLFFFVETSDAP